MYYKIILLNMRKLIIIYRYINNDIFIFRIYYIKRIKTNKQNTKNIIFIKKKLILIIFIESLIL